MQSVLAWERDEVSASATGTLALKLVMVRDHFVAHVGHQVWQRPSLAAPPDDTPDGYLWTMGGKGHRRGI